MNKSLILAVGATGAVAIVALQRLFSRKSHPKKNERVVITGASSGIGAEIARQYARRGASIIITARRIEELEKVAAECRSLGSPMVEVCVTDVSNAADCERVSKLAIEKFNGELDTLVLNAGIGMRGFADELTDVTIYKRLMDTNYLGCVYMTHYMMPLITRAQGRFLVVSSVCGRLGLPRYLPFFACLSFCSSSLLDFVLNLVVCSFFHP